MEKYSDALLQCPLFAGIDRIGLKSLLDCVHASKRAYGRGSFIFMEAERIGFVGALLSGSLHIIQEDFWGNRSILARVEPPEIFAEAFACAGLERSPVSVVAVEDCEVLAMDFKKIVAICPQSCAFHARLIENMLGVLARKNVSLVRKLEHVAKRGTRGKLLSYLSSRALEEGADSFDIPFKRQELADYLSVDRSAMSSEMSKMRKEGLLSFYREHFQLLKH
ncbi:MAG: Crp/Fnr family transcriptional regulator [Synergistaceae bacterium]|jgi:CRP-like cAMP-binding protein|nr:Crp/Fnr family transcriptional regulator [Synergistaceae bacterium]